MAVQQKPYFKLHAHTILDNGYEPIPITPYQKFPNFKTWTSIPEITHAQIDKWASNGHAKDGVGIRTKHTPFLDLDTKDDACRIATIDFVENLIGTGPIRVGFAPKMGMLFRTDKPFSKVLSRAYKDPNGNKAQLEFLGDGQQFAALGVHPDTKKPYKWVDKGMNPIVWPAEDLAVVTREQAEQCKAFFENWCEEQGWEPWGDGKKTSTALTVSRNQGDDIWDGNQTGRCGLTIEQVRSYVERLPNDDTVEYEDGFSGDILYTKVIFAIFHETEGSNEGRDIAEEWSEKSPKHDQEPGRFMKLWGSADAGDRENPITFRYIIRIVNQIEQDEKHELCANYLESLTNVDDVPDLKNLIATIKQTKFDELDTAQLAAELAKAYKRLIGTSCTPAQAKKLIRHEPTGDDIPAWVKPWAYILHTKKFYNTETGLEIDREAFDSRFTRELDGYPASQYALNIVKIPTYWMTMYKPDADKEFYFEGHPCVNTFSERLMPPMPAEYSKGDRKAIRLLKAHLKNILPNARERALLLSFLAYVVQTRQRPNWATVLQGVDGDGKSFFGDLMGAILGSKNVRKLDPQQLEAPHTGWAIGQLFGFIEEIRLLGHNRHDILNKVKPFISNAAINVHPKGVTNYTALNTTAYFATTNFIDALPINDNDRRWLILMSRWQSGEALRQFLSTNKDYFKNLFAIIDNHAGALRKFLMEYELHEDFEPKGRAPLTAARERMIEASKTEVQVCIENVIAEDSHPRIGPELVISNLLIEILPEMTREHVSGKTVASILSSLGYNKLSHRIRLSSDQPTLDSVWVKDVIRFDGHSAGIIRHKVLKFLEARQDEITHRDDV